MVEIFRELRSITLYETGLVIDSDVFNRMVQICRKENKKISIVLCGFARKEPTNGFKFMDADQVIFKSLPDFIYRKAKKQFSSYTFIK